MKSKIDTHPSLPYIIPFVVFLILTGISSYTSLSPLWIYPIKAIIVGILLLGFKRYYTEIRIKFSFLALVAGLLVFIAWIAPDGYYPLLGKPGSFDPYELGSNSIVILWICFRMIGAVVVVPIMEELFWRSFLTRYLINSDFKSVPIGKFSWLSMIITVILFGVEHQQWLPGIFAGIIYNLLLYRTKSIFSCIIAHALTNLMLGIYVLITHQWAYW